MTWTLVFQIAVLSLIAIVVLAALVGIYNSLKYPTRKEAKHGSQEEHTPRVD